MLEKAGMRLRMEPSASSLNMPPVKSIRMEVGPRFSALFTEREYMVPGCRESLSRKVPSWQRLRSEFDSSQLRLPWYQPHWARWLRVDSSTERSVLTLLLVLLESSRGDVENALLRVGVEGIWLGLTWNTD